VEVLLRIEGVHAAGSVTQDGTGRDLIVMPGQLRQ
jgi:hypothetical protein